MITAQLQPYPDRTSIPQEDSQPSVEQSQDRDLIKLYLSRIQSSKRKFKPDFDRMRRNMEFVSGLQYDDQIEMDDDRYINNLTIGLVAQKVASLYAKNPTAIAIRRERLDYEIWDGKMESLMEALQEGTMMAQQGIPLPPEVEQLIMDFQSGKERQRMVQRVCDTLEILYQYYVDAHHPDFKESLKQLVRRVIICGVGYVRPILCIPSATYQQPFTTDTKNDLQALIGRIHQITNKLQEETPDTTDSSYATLRSLVSSLGVSQQESNSRIQERLEFDFPPATSVIVDERCRSLKDFVSARWIAIQYVLPVEEVNAIFGVDIKTGGGGEDMATEFSMLDGYPMENKMLNVPDDPQRQKLVCLYELFNKTDGTRSFLCDGWKDWVMPPEPIWPNVQGFWHLIALTFNDIETESGIKSTIYPPSDVQRVKSPQKEWNRTRDALRHHRNANAPKYLVRKGFLTEDDKNRLQNAEPNAVIELEGVPLDQPIEKFVVVFQSAPIDAALYDTAPLELDIMNGGGMQQANLGPAQPGVTATVGSIAEQSRLNVSSSNIDDLDGVLSRLAQMSGEMMFQGISIDTVKRIVGIGAVWPDTEQARTDFTNEVYLQIQAASSGRPNKALEISNFGQVAPLLMQAGANPIGVVEEGVKRLDDQLDVSSFFPLTPQAPPGNGNAQEKPLTSEGNSVKASGNATSDGTEAPPAGQESPSQGPPPQ